MTTLQKEQFNRMRTILIRISKEYMTPEQIQISSQKKYGLDYNEALEMSYENMQSEAYQAIRNVKEIK